MRGYEFFKCSSLGSIYQYDYHTGIYIINNKSTLYMTQLGGEETIFKNYQN